MTEPKIYTGVCNGEKREVQIEQWAWAVIYDDGKEFRQFEEDGTYHFMAEIEMPRVRSFVVYQPADQSKRFDIVTRGNVQLFMIYRMLRIAGGTPQEVVVRTPVFGWKNKETGDCAYHYILPNGALIMSAGHDSQEVSAIIEGMVT